MASSSSPIISNFSAVSSADELDDLHDLIAPKFLKAVHQDYPSRY
jgi:hypothetical protein